MHVKVSSSSLCYPDWLTSFFGQRDSRLMSVSLQVIRTFFPTVSQGVSGQRCVIFMAICVQSIGMHYSSTGTMRSAPWYQSEIYGKSCPLPLFSFGSLLLASLLSMLSFELRHADPSSAERLLHKHYVGSVACKSHKTSQMSHCSVGGTDLAIWNTTGITILGMQ